MTFKIDDDVPVPVISGRGRPMIYPFPSLKVGHSFFVECDVKMANNIGARAADAAKRQGAPWKFARRKEGNGYRFWRVS